jgi:hypothetical protein
MAGESPTIQTALLALVRGINGAGGYTLDLSTTTQIGIPPDTLPPPLPRAYLYVTGANFGWDGADLRSYLGVLTYRIVVVGGLAADVADTDEAREEVVLAAMEDLMRAIASNPNLSNLCLNLEAQFEPFVAVQRNASYLGCFANVTIPYIREP